MAKMPVYLLETVFLGVVQGLTEFFPVSSSGHLVLLKNAAVGFQSPPLLLEVVLHLGTVFAILLYFWKDIVSLRTKDLGLLLVASLPAGLVGFLFRNQIKLLFDNLLVTGFSFLLTAGLVFLIDKVTKKKGTIDYKKALFIGFFQAVAILPGVSRSGSTIYAGVKSGLSKERATRFSFILSVPAVLGANFLELTTESASLVESPLYYLLGFASAFISGYLAIIFLLKLLAKERMIYFSFYLLLVGVLTLALAV